MGKKKYKKGIDSLEKEISVHREKLRLAEDKRDSGLVAYYKDEIEEMKSKIEIRKIKLLPRNKRIKVKKSHGFQKDKKQN